MNDVQIRVIILEDGQHLDNVVRKCEKGWIIRFVRGCSLLGKDVTVKTSLTGDSPLQWSDGHDHLSVHCQVECKTAGSFQYKFYVDGSTTPSGSGYFLVMPQLTVNGSALPLDAVSCQTHLVKLLGSLSDWESRLRVAKECGYNMLHLTPIHRLGVSNSSYSIMDHHNLNDTLHSTEKEATFEDVKNFVDKLEKEWNMLTVQDVVWNHAAKNAPWLLEHPECAYNCFNSPHLRPAYVVDRVYHYFGKEVAAGKWEHRGISPVVENVHQTNAIEYIMRTEVLPKIRLHEFFQTNAETAVSKFTQMVAEIGPPTSNSPNEESKKLKFDGNPEWTRFGMRLDLDLAVKLFNKRIEDVDDEEERQKACIEEFTLHLEKLQEEGAAYAWEICLNGLHAVMGGILYERVQDHGPKKGLVDEENPLTTDYFLHLEPESDSWEEDEKLAYDPEKSKMLMAFNGWVMSGNALDNFALPTSEVYLRRELVCWGDSVKLNYGEKPEDAPYLWEYMKTYTKKCASTFHGLRIDNAHSTPIHLAEFMLREARKVREDIYVFAELFTGSEQLDNLFVNRLGISSLIREAQSAHDSHEQGRLVYRYGGDCVGAMLQKHSRLAAPAIAHGLFLDQSHDNPSPIQKRTIYDMLPTCAMVSMANCAIGSTRGYDELVRHAIHVVTEKRPYAKWGEQATERTGVVTARRRLNDLHVWLALNGYSQVFVDQMNEDVVGITRHNPQTHDTVILVARTAFDWGKVHRWTPNLKHFPFGGHLEEIIFEMEFLQLTDQWNEENNEILTGLAGYVINMREHLQPEKARMCKVHGRENGYIELCDFPSGAVIAFKVRMSGDAVDAVKELRNLIGGGNEQINKELTSALENTTLQNFNRLLFHCEAEEQAEISEGAYDIPKFGKFVYCGLQGLKPILDKIRINNDLGHPLCQNLRDGLWLPENIVKRTAQFEELVQVSQVLKKIFEPLKDAPYYLRPAYFEALFAYIYRHVKAVLLGKMNPELRDYSSLVRRLTIATVSFMGYIPGADLAPLPNSAVLTDQHPSSLSAGLPHFSTGIWRNWGRDTFIALPGCLLATRRWDDARNIIISFGGSMRHGLIPNLLAEGKGARFNCRDAVWFWLSSIVDYVSMAPDGKSLLAEKVRRIYPEDDTVFGENEREEPLLQTMLEAIDRHFEGIEFRERNAGSQIDEHMRDEGFNVKVQVDKVTGFIHGGNRWNCGTWMDKMGSSEKAGNRGEPATPRDGAAVELQALAYKVLKAMNEWSEEGVIERKAVKGDETWTWKFWAEKIAGNFEKNFYVDDDCSDKLVNRRGIIKDTVGASLDFADFQLRPNFTIALAMAPELVDPNKAWRALDAAKQHLLGPIGIKTLDPSDWAYCGNYNNDDDGWDKKTAKGWNYHQGPEWLWVAAFYLRARLAVGNRLGGKKLHEAVREVQSRLGNYYRHIDNSVWLSLPELTNENGSFCAGSCPTQAWSVGCLLEACQDLGNTHRSQAHLDNNLECDQIDEEEE